MAEATVSRRFFHPTHYFIDHPTRVLPVAGAYKRFDFFGRIPNVSYPAVWSKTMGKIAGMLPLAHYVFSTFPIYDSYI